MRKSFVFSLFICSFYFFNPVWTNGLLFCSFSVFYSHFLFWGENCVKFGWWGPLRCNASLFLTCHHYSLDISVFYGTQDVLDSQFPCPRLDIGCFSKTSWLLLVENELCLETKVCSLPLEYYCYQAVQQVELENTFMPFHTRYVCAWLPVVSSGFSVTPEGLFLLPSFCPWLAFLIVRNLIPLVLRLIPVQAPRMERLPPPGGCRRVEAPSLRGSWPRGIAARLCLLVCIPSPTRLACCPSTRPARAKLPQSRLLPRVPCAGVGRPSCPPALLGWTPAHLWCLPCTGPRNCWRSLRNKHWQFVPFMDSEQYFLHCPVIALDRYSCWHSSINFNKN